MPQTVIVGDQTYEFPDGMDDKAIAGALKLDTIPREAPPIAPIEGASPWEVGQMPSPKEATIAAKPIIRGGAQLLTGIPASLAGSPIAGGAAATLTGMGVDALYGDVKSPGSYAAEGLLNTVLPAAAAKGLDYFGRSAIRSALKIPPTQITREGADKVVDTMVKENLRVGAKGMEKGRQIVTDIEGSLSNILKNSGSNVEVGKVIAEMEAQKARYANSLEADTANAIIDRYIKKFAEHANVQNLGVSVAGNKYTYTGTIPISKAQDMKKATYRELQDYYRNTEMLSPKAKIINNAESVVKAAEARGLREQIMSDPTVPKEATDWLKKESNVLEAMRWIQRRANVGANMDPITFNDVLVGGLIHQGVPAAVAVRFIRIPAVQSQMGIWMAKAAPKAAAPLQAGAIGTNNLLLQ